MFIDVVPNRGSPPAVLLRESLSRRERSDAEADAGQSEQAAGDVVEALKAILKGGTLIGGEPMDLPIERSLPHGHVAAVLGMIRKIALDRLILSTAKDAEAGAIAISSWR